MAKAAKSTDNGFAFGAAPKVDTTSKAKKSDRVVVAMKHIADFGAIDAMKTILDSVGDVLEAEIKGEMQTYFIEKGCAAKAKPDNFIADEDGHTANCQLRRRSSASVLTDDELAILESKNIPVEPKEITAGTFVFNPAYLNDGALMAKIEEALRGIPGLPTDIIQEQVGKTVQVVSDASITAAFQLTPEECAEVLPILTTKSLGPKFNVIAGDITPVIDRISKVLAMPQFADTIANAKKKEKKTWKAAA